MVQTSSPTRRRPVARTTIDAIAAVLLSLSALAAQANDRPFQVARTAVAEDDEQTWSIESWVQRYGSVRGVSFEPEYTFTDRFSVQVEFTRLMDRHDAETGHEAEIEFKYLFNDIARDGWGLAVSSAFSTERTRETRESLGGSARSAGLRVPLSIALGAEQDRYLHLNVDVEKTTGERRHFGVAAAVEQQLASRSWAFAEWAKSGPSRYAQVGVRHWLKREQLAIDFSLQQFREDGTRASGFLIGLGWYDL